MNCGGLTTHTQSLVLKRKKSLDNNELRKSGVIYHGGKWIDE